RRLTCSHSRAYLLLCSSVFFSSPCIYSSLLRYDHAHPRYLHSFPTRRSSDLNTRFETEVLFHFLVLHNIVALLTILLNLLDQIRSEEHTSELQSRFDLVCRLLLEKKKRNKHV